MVEENKTEKVTTSTTENNNQQRGGYQGRGGSNNRGGFQRNGGSRPPRRDAPAVEEKVWVPKTILGKEVLAGKYSSIDEVILSGKRVMEEQITDFLIPNLQTEFINIGQAKGKFGGGKRKISKSTQKITKEGGRMSFAMGVISGNKEGVIGLGIGKARETVPSREKAVRDAKHDMILIRRGCGDWGCFCGSAHSIPFAVEGRCSSARVILMPAPKGTGLVVESELKKMLELAGVKDVWSKTFGQTKNKINLMKAGFAALKQLQEVKLTPQVAAGRGIKEGSKDE